jgi:hypothetical protein
MKHVFGGFFQAQTGFAYGSKTVTVPIVVVRTTKEEAIGWCMEEGRRQFPVPEYFGHTADVVELPGLALTRHDDDDGIRDN